MNIVFHSLSTSKFIQDKIDKDKSNAMSIIFLQQILDDKLLLI